MQQLVPRQRLLHSIRQCLQEAPATVLLGARQTGKTTLAQQLVGSRQEVHYFDLERAAAREALSTPELTLGDCDGLVVIDEVQRLPGLFEVLRPLCDRPDQPATFLLLGSASPDLVRGVSETLAGRALFVRVPGFAVDETGPDEQNRLWLRGGFPRAFLSADGPAAFRWLESFAATFLDGRASPWSRCSQPLATVMPTSGARNGAQSWTCCCCEAVGASGSSSSAATLPPQRAPCMWRWRTCNWSGCT